MALAALLAGSSIPVVAASVVNETAKITAGDGAANDRFGSAVAVSGDTVAVGAPSVDGAVGADSGAVYVYVRSGGDWTLEGTLTASDAAAGDAFGTSVAIDGDTVVVGAPFDDNSRGTDEGAAYVFVRTGTTWDEEEKLLAVANHPAEHFGTSVAVSGDTTFVSARGPVVLDLFAGTAYAYVRYNGSWNFQWKFIGHDWVYGDSFGGASETGPAVALSGNTAIVGAFLDDHAGGVDAGSAYVFERSGPGWFQRAKLVASNATPDDKFGSSVALSGNTAAVGAVNANVGGFNWPGGAVYVFERVGCTWREQARVIASDHGHLNGFGSSVAVEGDTMIVGSFRDDQGSAQPGSAFVFTRVGTLWSEQAKLVASDAQDGDRLGARVALAGGTAVVGAPADDTAAGVDAGSVSVLDGVPDSVELPLSGVAETICPAVP